MRFLTLFLFILLALVQYPLWLGKGGWLKVWDLESTVQQQNQTNQGLQRRNASLEAEVRDLKDGTSAIEERARVDLGMIRDDEIFVHIVNPAHAAPPASPSLNTTAPASTTVPALMPAPVVPTPTMPKTAADLKSIR